jgi:threonine/homoserine/homoserine lactone efflux protein
MTLEQIWPLLAFVSISTFTPGAATTLATSSGAHFGFRRSVPVIAGLAGGLAMLAIAASAGLTGLLLAMPSLQLLAKAIGSAYLLWLACKIAQSGTPRGPADNATPLGFISSTWMMLYNPKGWSMTLSAAASFGTLASGPLSLAISLGLAFGSAAAASLSAWCLAGGMLARWLRTDRQWRMLNVTLGVLLAVSIVPMWLS